MSAIFKTALALAGIALAAAAECSEDDKEKVTKCAAKLENPGEGASDKKICDFVKDSAKCLAACCDTDEGDAAMKLYKETVKDIDDCEVECGAGSMLAPGVAALTAAVVALKLM